MSLELRFAVYIKDGPLEGLRVEVSGINGREGLPGLRIANDIYEPASDEEGGGMMVTADGAAVYAFRKREGPEFKATDLPGYTAF